MPFIIHNSAQFLSARHYAYSKFNNYVGHILPNFNPSPLEWTNMVILHTIYPMSRDPLFLST